LPTTRHCCNFDVWALAQSRGDGHRSLVTPYFVWARCFTKLCVCHTTPTQKLFCLHVFRHAGPPQRVDCLALKWETALSVFPKDTATRYRIWSRTEVSKTFRLPAHAAATGDTQKGY